MGRLLLVVALMALAVLAGCAGTAKKKPAPRPTGFSSADEKSVHEFMEKYPAALMRGDVRELMRLYTDDAKVVPLLGGVIRPIRAGEMKKRLPGVVAEERRVGLRVVFHEPMHIEVKGERASVRLVASLAWKDKGKEHKAKLNCFFGLVQDEHYIWRIKEAHGEPVRQDFALPLQKKPLPPREPKPGRPRTKPIIIKGEPEKVVKPAPSKAPPAPEGTEQEAPPAPAPDVDKGPQPLF
ncbi:YybH family protein [Solidesulfovibrio sp. C21]|uniref:YybH family protein n=1 Tax=Solidesulfovibrio sp. C21 TaxID=3398613 RepID=UPI0039FD5489